MVRLETCSVDHISQDETDDVGIDGVYKAGFAASQSAYEAAVVPLFDSLDRLEKMLVGKDHLIGDRLTESDVRLFVTIVSLPLSLPALAKSQYKLTRPHLLAC